jgi:hypothetical protein
MAPAVGACGASVRRARGRPAGSVHGAKTAGSRGRPILAAMNTNPALPLATDVDGDISGARETVADSGGDPVIEASARFWPDAPSRRSRPRAIPRLPARSRHHMGWLRRSSSRRG